VFLSLTFWRGIWTIPIAWVLDRLPRGWIYWVGAFGLGALPPTLTTWFVIFPLKGLAERRRRIGRGRQCADRQRHLGSRICIYLVSDVCCADPCRPRKRARYPRPQEMDLA
jgi:hypothetical protein